MTREDEILGALGELQKSVGRLEGTMTSVVAWMERTDRRVGVTDRRVRHLENGASRQAGRAEQAGEHGNRRHNWQLARLQGVYLVTAAVLGAGAGGIFHALGWA